MSGEPEPPYTDPPADGDPRRELELLVAALGAHAERLQGTGATGLAPSPNPPPVSSEPPARHAPPQRLETGPPPSPARGAHRQAPSAPQAPPSRPPSPPAPRAASASPTGPTTGPAGQRGAPPNREEAHRQLEVLAAEVASCTGCRLHEGRTQTVFARGSGSSGLCFVGEGPGFDEDKQGFPFVGKAGKLLDRMIAAMGFDRDEVYVCNIVKCRPPDNRKPEPEEMAACRSFLEQQLTLVDPTAIVALGATAVEGLLGVRGGITRLRGNWRLYTGRIPVMPTFHPAYLLRNPKAKRDVWSDLQDVLRHMGRPIPSKKTSAS